MKAIKQVFLVLFCTSFSLVAGISFAQEKASAQLQAELVGSWMVTVAGDSKLRILKVMNVSHASGGTVSLDAVFGLAGEKENSVSAELNQTAQERKLFFTSKSGATIAAIQQPDGSFVGTYEINGKTKGLKIVKVAADGLLAITDSAREARAAGLIVTPADDVPIACASFSGKWAGSWIQGGVGMMWLWVAEVNAKCVAKIAYLDSSITPTSFGKVEIKDGVLKWICNEATNGTCVLTRHSDELWANYSNPAGGTNTAVFRKIQ